MEGLDSSTCFADADRVALGLVVEGLESHRFLGCFGQYEILPWGFVAGTESLGVLEDALHLDLYPAFLAVPDVCCHFETPVFKDSLLKSGTRDTALHPVVHRHELRFVLESKLGGVLGSVRAALMTGDYRACGVANGLAHWATTHRNGNGNGGQNDC